MGDFGGPFDAIVIGSGMSGLSAANILAKRGQKVLLLEQHYHYGGYLQNFVLHRTPFDSGCHYVGALGEGQVFDRYLRYLGARDSLKPIPLDPEGFDVLDYSTWRFAIPVGYERLEARLFDAFPNDRIATRAFLDELRREVSRFPMYTLARTEDPRGTRPDVERSLDQVLRESGVTNPRLYEVLSSYRALYYVEPKEAPFSMHAFVFDSFIQGAYGLQGGGNAVAKALLSCLRARGGVARRRTRVVAVDVKDGAVTGIRTEAGEREETKTIIACIDPKVAVSLLPPDAVRSIYRSRVMKLKEGIGGLGAYLRVEGDLSRFAGANLWLRQSEGEDPLFTERWLHDGSAPPVFVTVPSAREPSWKGPNAVIVLSGLHAGAFERWSATSTGGRGADYERFKSELGERMLEPVRPFLPELARGLLTIDVSTPLTHRDYTLNAGGAIYGIHHSLDQSAGRGVSWRTRVKGFLLSGHSVLYPGLIGATISAFYTCGELFGLATLHKEVVEA